ncbi:hypothetical protein H4R34_000824 [Dimargaris verticillata]|uniref:Uncharacterized protein n=1 Tax=Dimargaris verticillata TaxID=2761393 RepID=A0A9W8EEC1_9FUNG|nr:hypothetical protein H4R34_000824 [Dimargaris verticillata]
MAAVRWLRGLGYGSAAGVLAAYTWLQSVQAKTMLGRSAVHDRLIQSGRQVQLGLHKPDRNERFLDATSPRSQRLRRHQASELDFEQFLAQPIRAYKSTWNQFVTNQAHRLHGWRRRRSGD